MLMIYDDDNWSTYRGPDRENPYREDSYQEKPYWEEPYQDGPDREDPYREQQDRQKSAALEKALEKRQRRQFSYVGLSAAAFMLINLAAQLVVLAVVNMLDSLVGDTIDFYGTTGRMLISAIPMYLVAFPATVGLLQLIPKCGAPQKEQWGFGRFTACFVIAMGIGLAGNLLGMLVGILEPADTDGSSLNDMLIHSSIWLNLLITVIMAPVVEELFFRKLVMDRLLGYGQKTAVIMSGLMFGLAHGNFSQFFYAFGIGVLWAYVYAKTGRIGYTIGFHMLFNLLGGVFAVELSKGAMGALEGPWILKQVQQLLGIDLGWLVTAFSSIMILAYLMFMVACLIAAITLLIVYRRQITFQPGQWPIRKGKAFRTAAVNAGMILYFLICCGMFVLSW